LSNFSIAFRSGNETEIYAIFEENSAKTGGLVLFGFWAVISYPLFYYALEYEKDQSNRTLINELVAGIVMLQMTTTFLVNLTSFTLFSFGPLPTYVCHFDEIMRPVQIFQIILLLDAILIVRYMFVFHLKNPTATQDDFWTFFIILWSFLASVLVHFVFAFLPGYKVSMVYICLGRFPAGHNLTYAKRNFAMNSLLLISFIAHIMVGVRYSYYKYQEKRNLLPQVSSPMRVTIQCINKATLASFFGNFFSITLLVCTSYSAHKMIAMDKHNVNEESEFIWIYIYTLYSPALLQMLCLAIFVHQNPALKVFMIKQIKDSRMAYVITKLKGLIPNNNAIATID